MYYQMKKNPDNLETMSAYDHVLHQWSYASALGSTYANNVAKFYGLGSAYGNHINEYKNQDAHNWMDDVMRTGDVWNHDVSINGGTEHTKIYGGVSYLHDKGILINSGFRRWSGNFKLTQDITKNLTWTSTPVTPRWNSRAANMAMPHKPTPSIPSTNPSAPATPPTWEWAVRAQKHNKTL